MVGDYAAQALALSAMRFAFTTTAIGLRLAATPANLMGIATPYSDASAAMLEFTARDFDKPSFNLPQTSIDGHAVPVSEHVVLDKPFGNLLHFERDTDRNDPKVLLVAPMSGHYATLLRGTVEALLPHHDVYITDWKNAKNIPVTEGRFGFDDYVTYLQDFMRHLGPNTHVMAVCQPTVPLLSAVSLMAQHNDPNQPVSMTLLAGPIDTGAAPTAVTKFAQEHDLEWFKNNALSTVPPGFRGSGRIVYPSFKQITAFMAMKPDHHVKSFTDMFNHLASGDGESAAKIGKFYDEYLAGSDLPGEFYMDTIDRVFQRRCLAKGNMVVHGETVDPSAIRKTALLTTEGGKDDICAIGQTSAAHKLCNNISPRSHFHYLQPDSGHYGVFEGRRWREDICPRITAFIRQSGARKGLKYSPIPGNILLMPSNFLLEKGRAKGLDLAA